MPKYQASRSLTRDEVTMLSKELYGFLCAHSGYFYNWKMDIQGSELQDKSKFKSTLIGVKDPLYAISEVFSPTNRKNPTAILSERIPIISITEDEAEVPEGPWGEILKSALEERGYVPVKKVSKKN